MTEWSEERLSAGDKALEALHEALRRADPNVKPRRRRRVRNAIASTPAEIERTSEYLGSMTVAGEIHAAYPTALYSLCGLRRGSAEVDPSGPAPGCSDCVTTAVRCAAIDASAPAHWELTSKP